MVKFRQISLTAALLCATTAATAAPQVYVIPDDAKCVVRKSDKLTYCTDKEGTPVTGELHRYKNNSLYRLYPLQNGILEGTSLLYYPNGHLKSEKPYKKGVLDGTVKEYYPDGTLESETPYVKGQKEGIAKSYNNNGKMFSQMIYTDNELNGEMRLYTPEGKTGNIDMAVIPPVVIEALNNACLELQHTMTTSACAATFNASSTVCDEKWRRNNRKEVRKYLADCAKGKVD